MLIATDVLVGVGDLIAGVGLVATAVAILLAYRQLRDTRNFAEAQLQFAIDESLAPFEDLRRAINQHAQLKDPVEVRRYVAALGRIGVLLKAELVRPDRINNLYGGRVEKLLNYEASSAIAINLVKRDPDGWKEFVWLWESLDKFRSLPRRDPGP